MATTENITTADQLLARPNLGRCELVRGELIMMSPSGFEHGRIVGRIAGPLFAFVESQQLGVITGAETGFYIERRPDTVRAPDVGFVKSDRVHLATPRGFFPGAPDLAVEVLSPDDRPGEVQEKTQAWLAAGCLSVWLVDPEKRTITVHTRAGATAYAEADTLVDPSTLPGFELPVRSVFAR